MSEGAIEHAETPGRSDASALSFDTWAQVPQYSEVKAQTLVIFPAWFWSPVCDILHWHYSGH